MKEFVATPAPRLETAARAPWGLVPRILLTTLAVISVALVMLQVLRIEPVSQLPFTIERATSSSGFVVRERSGEPLPASISDGDAVVWADMTRVDRAMLLWSPSVPPGSRMTLVVIHAGHVARVPVSAGVARFSGTGEFVETTDAVLSTLFVFGLALLTLWRGRDGAAFGLATFSLTVLLSLALETLSVPSPVNVWFGELAQVLQTLIALPALYVLAESLARSGLSPRWVAIPRSIVIVLALVLTAASVASVVLLVYFAFAPPLSLDLGSQVVLGGLSAVPVVILIKGYRDGAHESRLRIRWVLWSTALLFGSIIALSSLSATRDPVLFPLISLLQGLALLGYLYAVLRSRIVDVSFVVDRALVFALITALIFGVFSLLEQGMHHFATGDRFGWALQATVALGLAMVLSPLHHRLERGIERLFFGRQLRAIAALRRFASECAFVERADRLLELAIERLLIQSAAAAIYERTPSGYARKAAHDGPWPELIDVDDAVFVSLRAGAKEIDLESGETSIAAEGFAFPMTVAETLAGAVICRPRDGEQFAPDVRSALAEVARNLGMSLYILRNREQARLVADIAAERLDESAARRRAVLLMQRAT